MSMLDVGSIKHPLTALANSKLDKLEVFSSIASTNTYLMSQAPPTPGHFRVAIADHQTSGRGRHYRRWISAPGGGLCLSMAYTFAQSPDGLPAVTLALGVAIVDALRQSGIGGVSLKWPNDIVALDGKLGGILTEVQSGSGNAVTVVVGIGLNVDNADRIDLSAESDWAHRPVDLKSLETELPAREILAGTIIEHLYTTLVQFETQGFVVENWREHDWLYGRDITVDTPDRQITGRASGVDTDGALVVQTGDREVRVISGSIVMAGPRESTA